MLIANGIGARNCEAAAAGYVFRTYHTNSARQNKKRCVYNGKNQPGHPAPLRSLVCVSPESPPQMSGNNQVGRCDSQPQRLTLPNAFASGRTGRISQPRLKGNSMISRVVHYGVDECHRIAVLRSKGYAVENCNSLPQLHNALAAERGTDAVLMTEGETDPLENAITLTRSQCSAPLVLFRSTNGDADDQVFDLVIETLTTPQQWLSDIESLIRQCRLLSGGSRGSDMSAQIAQEYVQLGREER